MFAGHMIRRVVVSSALPVDVRGWLGDGVEVRAPAAGSLPRPALLAAVEDADALICLLTDRVDEELLSIAPRLGIVANFAVGFDNVDIPAATRRGVAVTNTPDVLNEATADLTFTLMLAAARRVIEGDELARSGAWRGWEPGQLLGAEVWGRTLGLVGFGRIGRAVARRGRGFGMRVLYTALGRAPEDVEAELGAAHTPLDRLLAESDFVSIHVPLTEATRHLVGARELARMKPTAILVNTARGACVDEAALADALERDAIAGAGLDVFEHEPRVHPRLARQKRAVLLPHLGSATHAARTAMARTCAENVAAYLAGRRPPNLLNPEALDIRRAG
jgi:glyoxylate reductase